MKLVIFGLTISSSWGNGHATLWRGLCRAMIRRGHEVVFFERDVPYYAAQRDMTELNGGQLCFYQDWESVAALAQKHLREADAGFVTSYCPDGISASELLVSSPARLRIFYDMDTPVTLARLEAGEAVPYLPLQGLGDFDVVLSYTGGAALAELKSRLGAKNVIPLYGSVDPDAHHPAPASAIYQSDLSYLGTYAADRQETLQTLFIEPARRSPQLRFVLGGSLYPEDCFLPGNVKCFSHVPPPEHSSFYCSSRLTLNITRAVMARMGYCPSGRLFEAAACGTPILTDWWNGLDQFFEPDSEIIIARASDDTVEALQLSDEQRTKIAGNARERTLAEHTAERRVIELERICESALNEGVEHSYSTQTNSVVSKG